MTIDKLDRRNGPGAAVSRRVSNAWTMPIKARIDMLSTGIRTPVGVKVYGPDLAEIERLARQIEAVMRKVPGTTSAFAERVIGGYYLDIEPDRAAARPLWPDDRRRAGRDRDARSAASRSPRRSRAANATPSHVRYPRDFRRRSAGDRTRGSGSAARMAAPIPLGQVA